MEIDRHKCFLRNFRLAGSKNLEDQHGVAITKETILASDRLGINFFKPGDALGRIGIKKSRNQAEQGGAGLMKVGDECINAVEIPWRINEDARFFQTVMLEWRGVLAEKILDRAYGGGAYRDAASASCEEALLCSNAQLIDFPMNNVLFDCRRHDRTEGAEADMKGQIREGNSLRCNFSKQLVSKVKSCSRGSCGDLSGAIGVNRLIAFPVKVFLCIVSGGITRSILFGSTALDIGWERHFTDAVRDREKVTLFCLERDADQSIGRFFFNGADKKSFQPENGAKRKFFAGP